ncbi:MAG TPA: heterodisulfide reductase-related iron-sulfur binding cluster [Candidatus Limnocylindria bacterium]|nr:heterodisulfide reductase-related iron-sulfur binding cluster [Candidatus Limnocylindria bacterium]
MTAYVPGADAPDLTLIRQCVHCGLCLPTCPTYVVLGVEMDNPRGRIRLMKTAHEGAVRVGPEFDEHIYKCLDCRACETACPSGVQFGKLVEAARAQVEAQRPRPLRERAARALFFEILLPRPRLLSIAARASALGARIGAPVLRGLGRGGALRRLADLTTLVPRRRLQWDRVPALVPAIGERRGRVLLFRGCVMRAAFGDVNAATARVLARNGFEVLAPEDQTCCGALHVHAGDRDGGRALARANIDRLERFDVDAVVVNAAGCGANLKEYGWLLKDDTAYAERARAFAGRVKDVTEFLGDRGVRDRPGQLRWRVTYDDPCHLLHGQKVREQPRALLAAIPGLEIAPLEEADMCCGSAGIYNVTHDPIARALLDRKVERIARTNAQVVVTANPGCAMQIESGLRRARLDVRVLHLVEVLDAAYATARP